jgi:hypothetical protein
MSMQTECEQCGLLSQTCEWSGGKLRCYGCRQKNEGRLLLFLLSAVILVCIGGVTIPPYMEMRTFNKFSTGIKATYWDAVFSDLRIMPK